MGASEAEEVQVGASASSASAAAGVGVGEPLGHEAYHEHLRESAYGLIGEYRVPLGIQPIWSIGVRIFCTREYPAYEGWCTWDEEKFSAEVGLCCALSLRGMRWVLLTELDELQGYREGNWAQRLVDTWVPSRREADQLLREFQFVRNQTIEEHISAVLGGARRPQSLRLSSSPFVTAGEEGAQR